MSISYVCFRQHKASCHLILVLVCTFPINLPYSTGKKGKALLHIFFVCLFALRLNEYSVAVKSDFHAHWANIFNNDFLFYLLLLEMIIQNCIMEV